LLGFRALRSPLAGKGTMILRWFDTTEVSSFAKSVSEEYARLRKSVAVRRDDTGKRAQKFDKLADKVKDFARDRKLNVYKKAKLLKVLGDGLRAQRVPEAEVSAFLDTLLLAPIMR
jgi:hypothetical protein